MIKTVEYEPTDDVQLKLALFSDLHIGADDVDHELMKRDLSNAKKENRRILINGDIAELILPSDKKRWSASKMNSQRDDVLNEALEQSFDILKPYADNIDLIGTGNHDESPIKYDSFDLVGALVGLLNREKTNGNIHRAGYQGYIKYMLRPKTKKHASTPFVIYHHHGSGGSAPVSKGMIDFNRIVYSHTANLYWLAHKHTAIQDNGIMRDRLNIAGNYVEEVCKAIITPGYKTNKIDTEKGYRIKYSDSFYNLQAKGYGICDVYLDKTNSVLRNFDVTLRT
jgi:hypothetical protein